MLLSSRSVYTASGIYKNNHLKKETGTMNSFAASLVSAGNGYISPFL